MNNQDNLSVSENICIIIYKTQLNNIILIALSNIICIFKIIYFFYFYSNFAEYNNYFLNEVDRLDKTKFA